MEQDRLFSLDSDARTKVEAQFTGLYKSTFEFVLENKGSMAEAREVYVKAFTYYMQLLELRGFDLFDKADTVIYSFSRKLWLHKLEKRRVELDFVKHRREFFEMEDAFHEIDSINERSAKTAEKLAEIGEPCRTLMLECVGRKKDLSEVGPRLGFSDEDRAFKNLVQCFRKLIKHTEGKEFKIADEAFGAIARYAMDGMESATNGVSEEDKVCLTMVSRITAMVRNHVIRTERVETFRAIQDKLTPQSVEVPEAVTDSGQTKRKVMKSISIVAVAVLAAVCVSALTAFSVSEAIHQKHKTALADEEAARASIADSLASLEIVEELPPVGISAFAVADGGYLLTAASPLKNGGKLKAIAEGSEGGHAVEVISIDTIADLALLRISDENVSTGQVPYRLAPQASGIGESVYSLGFPADFLAYADGSISNAGPDGKVRVRLQSASIGAPVIGDKGQVTGILLNASEDENGFFTLMPPDKISAWINETAGSRELNVPLTSRNRLFYSDRSKQIEQIRPFVYELKISQ